MLPTTGYYALGWVLCSINKLLCLLNIHVGVQGVSVSQTIDNEDTLLSVLNDAHFYLAITVLKIMLA